MRSRFDEQLACLNTELIEMGALCEEAIALASKALSAGDIVLAERVAPISSDIDRKEREIESRCLKLLLQQQPVARDLRTISSALKTAVNPASSYWAKAQLPTRCISARRKSLSFLAEIIW